MERSELEDRLLDFAVAVCQIVDELPATRIGNHVARQLIRCGSSPPPNYGEAQSAESRKDFIHKMKVCLKELREIHVWLRFIGKNHMHQSSLLVDVLKECNELTAIFVASVRTALSK